MRITLLAVAVVLLAGCAGTQRMSPSDVQSGRYDQLNRKLSGKVATVHFRDGAKAQVVGLRVGPDSTSWLDRSNNRLVWVGTDEVREVSLVKTGKGALAGLAAGIVLGTTTGLIRAAMEGDDPPGDPLALTQSEKFVIYPAALSVYSLLVTTPAGAIIGRRERYEIATTPRYSDNQP